MPVEVIFGFAALFVLIIFCHFVPIPLWVNAWLADVPVGLDTLVGMRLRQVDPASVIMPAIMARQAGLDVSIEDLESLSIAGGRVYTVVSAMIAASRANIPLTFSEARAVDLAGRDVLAAVRTSVNTRVIRSELIEAVARDGIQVKARVQITVRTDLKRLVGGAGEETILARVGEGIVTAIGKSDSFRDVLADPVRISDAVLERRLDERTAFEILSIDIADLDVGDNVGAKLRIAQANADKQVAQAVAEQRRADAVAAQTEMRARVEEMRGRLVEAQADVPRALAEALASGHATVLDYYKMENLIADTRLREALASGGRMGEGRS